MRLYGYIFYYLYQYFKFFIDSTDFGHQLTLFIIAVTFSVLGNGTFCQLYHTVVA